MSLGGSKAPGFRAEEQHDSSRLQIRWQCGKAHAHRFRDTFAVELLLAGVPIERVSILLGHQSVRITEMHYALWVRARQEQLEADVRRTWQTHEPERKVHGGYAGTDASIIPFKSKKEWWRRGESEYSGLLKTLNLLI